MIHKMTNIRTKEVIYLHPGDTAVCISGSGGFVEGCVLRFDKGLWKVFAPDGVSLYTFYNDSHWIQVKWCKIEATDISLEDLL